MAELPTRAPRRSAELRKLLRRELRRLDAGQVGIYVHGGVVRLTDSRNGDRAAVPAAVALAAPAALPDGADGDAAVGALRGAGLD